MRPARFHHALELLFPLFQLAVTSCRLRSTWHPGNRGFEDLGDRAVLLGISRHFRELGFVQVRHLGTQSESGATNAEALALRLYGDRGLGSELSRGIAAGLQPKRKRHGEA